MIIEPRNVIVCVSEKVIEKNKEVKGIRERLRVWKVELDVIIVIVGLQGGNRGERQEGDQGTVEGSFPEERGPFC